MAHTTTAPEVAAADFETTITVVIERGLIFVVIDDGETEKQHRVLDAEEIARIARKHGVVVGNVYFEECSDGFIRRVRGLITTSADTTALLAVEYASGVDYFDRLDRAADVAKIAPKPIWINTKHEAAFAVTCIQRRKTAAHFVA